MCVSVVIAHPAPFDIFLFSALTIPSLEGCKSYCVLFLLSQQREAICPCQLYFSKARENGGGKGGRGLQYNVAGLFAFSVISLQVG